MKESQLRRCVEGEWEDRQYGVVMSEVAVGERMARPCELCLYEESDQIAMIFKSRKSKPAVSEAALHDSLYTALAVFLSRVIHIDFLPYETWRSF